MLIGDICLNGGWHHSQGLGPGLLKMEEAGGFITVFFLAVDARSSAASGCYNCDCSVIEYTLEL